MTEHTPIIQQKIIPTTPFAYAVLVTKPHVWWMVGAFILVIIAAALDQGMSYLYKLIIDAVQANNVHRVYWLGLCFPVLVFLVQILFRASGYLGMRWSTSAQKEGYDYMFAHTINHSHSFFSNRFAGALHSKIRNIVEGLDDLIPELLWTYTYAIVALLVTLSFVISVDYSAAVIFAVLVAVLLFLNIRLAPQKERLSKLSAEQKTKLQASIIDVFSNVSAARQYAQMKRETETVADLTKKVKKARQGSWFQTEYILFINGTVLFVFSLTLFWVLINKWSEGLVTTGQFVLIASLIIQLSGTLLFIGRAFNSTSQTIGEMKEGLSELMIPYEIVDVEQATDLKVQHGGAIIWSDVSFNFESNPNSVFSHFNLEIPAGQRVGLVGASGAGKSTFVSLLLRQHEVSHGSITIDGQDIAQVTQASLRANIAVVPQEPALFHRSIRENIAYGRTHATQKEIETAAKQACAHEFIMSLPAGYDTLVGERGVKLSGGQKQRVAIARAMLKNAPILILDEATSALDSESEVEIQKALHELMAGKTVVAVAHRLSTLREMDRILVLAEGRIIEDGTHDTLKDVGGTYAKLWAHQAGGFLVE